MSNEQFKKRDTKKTVKVRPPEKNESKPAKTSSKSESKTEKRFEHKPLDPQVKPKVKPSKVEHGHMVSVHYTGTLKNGEKFDSSENHGPIQFVVGSGQVIQGFDKAVVGMKVNDSKKFTIPKHEAYGDVNPALIQIVPLDKIPENVRGQLKVGGFLVMQSPMGQQMPVKIVKMDKENVHLDMNHPLAGQDLTFDIQLVEVDHAPENFGHDHGSDDGCCSGHGECACDSGSKKDGKRKKPNGEDCCGGGCCHDD
ncbi:MAG TPA: peptidylprolyl isomerase [Alphaproteobacteria bacterium]|nr:peptidylprolyl isomerase [Alphaproteobacteria bacterium]